MFGSRGSRYKKRRNSNEIDPVVAEQILRNSVAESREQDTAGFDSLNDADIDQQSELDGFDEAENGECSGLDNEVIDQCLPCSQQRDDEVVDSIENIPNYLPLSQASSWIFDMIQRSAQGSHVAI
jgi:hypothetical protein